MIKKLDLTTVAKKNIYSLTPAFGGSKPNGEVLSFTNYYAEINKMPYFGISGEIHYSRVWEERWEDAILKMKAGGINTISTYVFWIHHEEEEGVFDFIGRRNLRRFVELCGKHGLYVIVRIGPFNHGEVRNGGLPDWLYGKSFEVRSMDDGFTDCVRRLYNRLAKEMKGLFYKDGGSIIAAQIENEYMHSAAPWEITTGVSNEWMTHGDAGDAYMLHLRDMARDEGIDVPFFTCTGWGGASTPTEMMPLWGGYAFRPWIFYSHSGEHPATEEYIYRDNHNDAVPETYNFEPMYKPESKPYLCCEMGGGMTCCYYYRFKLPFESVDAMANIKMASGCNMLGYYMYHGGTNPKSTRGVFLNEGQVPKLSYDYQAAIGEYGQLRDSYRRLRILHLFAKEWERELCLAKTVLPEGSQDILPEDADTLRYAVRIAENSAGFLFINNYQDHAFMKPKQNETIVLQLPDEDIAFENLSIAAGENCILPFNLDIGGVKLRSAHARLLTKIVADNELYIFFCTPPGMVPYYTFPCRTEIISDSNITVTVNNFVCVECNPDLHGFTAVQKNQKVRIITLTHEQSLNFGIIELNGQKVAVMTEGVILVSQDSLRLEHNENHVSLSVFPAQKLPFDKTTMIEKGGIFVKYIFECPQSNSVLNIKQVGPTRYTVAIPNSFITDSKELILEVDYRGDIGHAFINGEMIADNFNNGTVWEIGLKEFENRLAIHPLTIYITPFKEGSNVNVESVMAGRKEDIQSLTGRLIGVKVKPVYEWRLW